ncbi:MAG: hypothetical protein FWF05_02505 [Oscillospiraceae bacterium]|nr:hypothetical protein [Oscillospiraceae bacterium]
MNQLGGWLLGFGFSALIGGVLYAISPKGATDRALKTFISIFILAAALTPFLRGDIQFDAPELFLGDVAPENAELSELVGRQIEDSVERACAAEIKRILEGYGVEGAEIIVKAYTENGEIRVGRVEIYSPYGFEGMEREINADIYKITEAEAELYEHGRY